MGLGDPPKENPESGGPLLSGCKSPRLPHAAGQSGGARRRPEIRLSVRLSVRASVCPSAPPPQPPLLSLPRRAAAVPFCACPSRLAPRRGLRAARRGVAQAPWPLAHTRPLALGRRHGGRRARLL